MKMGSSTNYTVRVRRRDWDEPPEQAAIYGDIYTFDLNQVVSVSFVPAPGSPRPWSVDDLPADIADFTTADQARILEILTAAYSVTPDAERAGTQERFPWPFDWPHSDEPEPRPTTFYVSPDEFVRYVADLDTLAEIAGSVQSLRRRAEVVDHAAVRFVEDRILNSPLLAPLHARAVGRTR